MVNLNSQSSTQSESSKAISIYSEYTKKTHSNSIPKTLKFILQLVISIFILMATTSNVNLCLTLLNLADVKEGVHVCDLAL